MAKISGWRVGPDDNMEHINTSGNRSSVLSNSRHIRSISETSQLPPAVATVSPEAIRNYVHSKRVESYLIGDTLGEGSFAKVKEAFHILVGEKVRQIIINSSVHQHTCTKGGGAHSCDLCCAGSAAHSCTQHTSESYPVLYDNRLQ